MKHFLWTFLFFSVYSNSANCQQTKTLSEVDNFGNNPGNLRMFVYNNFHKQTGKIPLVVVLHGCGENAKSVAELTGWNKLAENNSFIVIYPQQKFFNNPNLCFTWFLNGDIEKGKGECASIFQMISYAKKHYPIDTNRIYITGLSAGAAMSVAMAAVYPALFKSVASFAGGAYKIGTNPFSQVESMLGEKNPSQKELTANVRSQNPNYKGEYPQMIIYQGLNDPIVNYRNAYSIVSQWTGIHNADTIPDNVENSFMGIEDISRKEYRDSSGKTVVILYEINNLGHRLLVKPGEKENEGGQTGIFGADKGFHSTYYTAKEFGIVTEK